MVLQSPGRSGTGVFDSVRRHVFAVAQAAEAASRSGTRERRREVHQASHQGQTPGTLQCKSTGNERRDARVLILLGPVLGILSKYLSG